MVYVNAKCQVCDLKSWGLKSMGIGYGGRPELLCDACIVWKNYWLIALQWATAAK